MKKSLKGMLASIVAMMVFVPVVNAEDVQEIKEVNITIEAPKDGEKVEITDVEETCTRPVFDEVTFEPTGEEEEYDCSYSEISKFATVTAGEDTYTVGDFDNLGKGIYITSYPSESEIYDKPFSGTFEEGKSYVVEVYLGAKEGYVFADNVVLKVNGDTTNYELSDGNDSGQLMFYAKVEATSAETKNAETKTENVSLKTYETLNGANQEYDLSSSDRLTFRFDIAYSEFQESGKVYMDGTLIDSSNYETKEGSTIVIFTKAYTDLLAAGNHTMKVTTDAGEASVDFTVKKTETTKNPQTSDNIISYVVMLVVSLAGLLLVRFYTTKNEVR